MTEKEKKADKSVVEKWEILSKVDFSKYEGRSESFVLRAEFGEYSCAWCGLYDADVKKCPLHKLQHHCCGDNKKDTWIKWCCVPSQKTARAMLRKVKKAIKVARTK